MTNNNLCLRQTAYSRWAQMWFKWWGAALVSWTLISDAFFAAAHVHTSGPILLHVRFAILCTRNPNSIRLQIIYWYFWSYVLYKRQVWIIPMSLTIRPSDWRKGLPSNRTIIWNPQPRQDCKWYIWAQTRNCSNISGETLLAIVVQQCSSSNMTEIDRFFREKWVKKLSQIVTKHKASNKRWLIENAKCGVK